MSKQKSADQRLIALESANQKLAAAQGELGKKQTRIAQLEADLAKLRSEAVAVEGEVASAKTEAARLETLSRESVGCLHGCLQTIRESVMTNPLYANVDRDGVLQVLESWSGITTARRTSGDSIRACVHSAAIFFDWQTGTLLESCTTGFLKSGYQHVAGSPDAPSESFNISAIPDLKARNIEDRRQAHERELAAAPILATA